MTNINKRNVNKAEEALQLAYKDLISFGKLFLPDDFMRSETPFFHYEIADAIDDRNVKQTAIIVPRGHGKTVLTKASIIKDFVFAKKENFFFQMTLCEVRLLFSIMKLQMQLMIKM